MQAIINGKLILPHSVEEKHILIFNDTIQALETGDNFQAENYDRIYDAQGHYVAPGFFNIHLHGIKGADAMDETTAAVGAMAKALPATGVTDFLPTTMTYDFARIATALSNIRKARDQEEGALVRAPIWKALLLIPDIKGLRQKNISKRQILVFWNLLKIL